MWAARAAPRDLLRLQRRTVPAVGRHVGRGVRGAVTARSVGPVGALRPLGELYGGPAVDLHDHVEVVTALSPDAWDAALADWWRAVATAPLLQDLLEGEFDVPAFFLRHERVWEQFKTFLHGRPDLVADLRPTLLACPPEVLAGGCTAGMGVSTEALQFAARPFVSAVKEFLESVYGKQLTAYRRARRLADLQSPQLWFPACRRLHRRWFTHLGPTNSGKTHAATSRLLASSTGVYMSPLRLLAWEMFERMRRAGLRCALRTGQERLGPDDAPHVACTVEMAPLNRTVEVAVIDEVQLVVDKARGAAWTRAILGVQAKELHLCGAAEPTGLLGLLMRLALDCGDRLQPSPAKSRLVPLRAEDRPLRGLDDVVAGDCVVCFTRYDIMMTKAHLEKMGLFPCTIYGSLPPSVRREQALLFNDPSSGRSVLVASDAIGMGLNLDIRRVVFRSLRKFDGEATRSLEPGEIRQIAGRAGRFGSRFSDCGLATCLNPEDLPLIQQALTECSPAAPTAPIQAAVFPSGEQLEAFSNALEAEVGRFLPFADLVERFLSLARVSPTYFIARAGNVLELARALTEVRLPPGEKFTFCQAPVSARNAAASAALVDFARRYAEHGCVAFPAVQLADPPAAVTARYILELEELHKVCDVYCWLATRLPAAFGDEAAADAARNAVAQRIAEALKQPLALSAGEEGEEREGFFGQILLDDETFMD